MGRLYSLTDAGRKVWDTQSSRVALDCRRVLGLVGHETDPKDLRAKLGWSEAALNEVLRELEETGMVKSIGAGPDATDLDFTGNFFIAHIEAAQQQLAREALDFTGPHKIADLQAAREKK